MVPPMGSVPHEVDQSKPLGDFPAFARLQDVLQKLQPIPVSSAGTNQRWVEPENRFATQEILSHLLVGQLWQA